MKIAIINGPNLNLLGQREKDIYGTEPFAMVLAQLESDFPETELLYRQSNVEGEIINYLQEADTACDGIILNAGGYTHTSVSVADCVKAISTPVVEVHISNILAREEYRHRSLISPGCAGSIMGFGTESYRLALDYFRNKFK